MLAADLKFWFWAISFGQEVMMAGKGKAERTTMLWHLPPAFDFPSSSPREATKQRFLFSKMVTCPRLCLIILGCCWEDLNMFLFYLTFSCFSAKVGMNILWEIGVSHDVFGFSACPMSVSQTQCSPSWKHQPVTDQALWRLWPQTIPQPISRVTADQPLCDSENGVPSAG